MRGGRSPSELREIELKLEVDPCDLHRLRDHAFFRSAENARRLTSIYFDTPKRALRQNGITLRVRSDGRSYTQTIKAERLTAGLALDRGEWEHQISSPEPDFEQAIGTPLEPFVRRKAFRQKLRPAFTVSSERVVSPVDEQGSLIELALDTGQIEADGRQISFTELELELKRGKSQDLFAAALSLAQASSLRLSQRTKADRGYALLEKSPQKSVKARQIHLNGDWSSARAFQVISNSCLQQLVENETLLREDLNPEAVHQARVAIRRLRAAISLFKDIVADEQIDPLKSELKWMADKLGTARDLDVFIAKSLEPSARNGDGEAVRLLKHYRKQRDEAYAEAADAIGSPRFSRAVLTIAAWIEGGRWLAGDVNGDPDLLRQPIGAFAGAEFDRRWRKARSRLKRIDKVDEATRHRARIDIKKIRYAAEFFMSLIAKRASDKRVQSTVEVIEGLQATLGDLNDIAVARSFWNPATERARPGKSGGAGSRTARAGQTTSQRVPFDRGLLAAQHAQVRCI